MASPFTVIPFVAYLIVANPATYKAVRGVAGSWVASADGLPTMAGLALHAVVLILLVTAIMRFIVPSKSKFSMELDMANLSEMDEFDSTMASFHPAAGSDILSPVVVAEGAPLMPMAGVPAPAPAAKTFLSSILGPSGTMKK
jgi:hypothetical protein